MNIIGRRRIWYLISLILILPGVVALFVWGLKTGIDFKGGTLVEIQFSQSVDKDKISQSITESGINPFILQTSGEAYIIKTDVLSSESQTKLSENLAKIGEYQQNRLETVGPTVSSDLKRKAIIAVILASLAIILYIAIAFRKVPKPASSWRFGVCAIIALTHDLLFVAGLFAILGHFFDFEIDTLFDSALSN